MDCCITFTARYLQSRSLVAHWVLPRLKWCVFVAVHTETYLSKSNWNYLSTVVLFSFANIRFHLICDCSRHPVLIWLAEIPILAINNSVCLLSPWPTPLWFFLLSWNTLTHLCVPTLSIATVKLRSDGSVTVGLFWVKDAHPDCWHPAGRQLS